MSDVSDDESFESAQSRASPRRAGGRRPNPGDEEAVVLSVRQQLQLRPSREFPSVPDLYGLARAACGVAASTERTAVRTVWPWYHHYCTQVLHRPTSFVPPEGPMSQRFGLGLYHMGDFDPPQAASPEQYDKQHVRNFVRWMAEVPVPRNLLGKCKQFLNGHLRAEFHNRLVAANHPFPTLPKVSVGGEGFIQSLLAESAHKQVDRARAEYRCIHSNVEKDITPEQTQQMLKHVFQPLPNGEAAKLDPVFRLVFAGSYAMQKADVRRGEEHYKQWYNHRYLRRNRVLGNGKGPWLHLCKSDRAKHNQQGRSELFGVIPHRDPLLDATAWSGVLFLYRTLILKEPFPDPEDYKRLWFYAAFPSLTPQEPNADNGGVAGLYHPISSEQYRKSWSSFFKDNKITTGHITKQWRHQSLHDGEDNGVDAPLVQKLAGWRHQQKADKDTQAQREHYGNNFPLRAGVSFAGGDPDNPKGFYLPRYVPVSDEFLCLFESVAPLVRRQKEIEELYNSFTTKQAQCRDRTATAHEVALNALEELRNGFRMLASRPVDPDTYLVKKDELCIFDMFRHGSTLEPLFDHPAFQHELWEDLKQRVRAAEDADFNAAFTLPPQPRNQLEQMGVQIHTMFRHFGSHVSQELQQTRDVLRQHAITTSNPPALVSPSTDPFLRQPAAPPGSVRQFVPVVDTAPQRRTGKRNRSNVTNEAIRRAELPESGSENIPVVLLRNKDRLFSSARDYWRLWKDEFEPLELKYGNAWRKDRQYVVEKPDGKRVLRKPNTKSTWWNERHFIWDCIAHYIAADGMSEEAAIERAEVLYQRSRRDTTKKKPLLRDLHREFSAEADRLEIRKVGRPRVDRLETFERLFPSQEGPLVGEDGAALGPNSSRRVGVERALGDSRTMMQQRWDDAQARGIQQQRLHNPSNPSGLSADYTLVAAQDAPIFRDWRHLAQRSAREQQMRDSQQRFDPTVMINRGRRVTLPGFHNFETALPAGVSTPPERTARYGGYRDDYTGTRWTQGDAESVTLLADMRDHFVGGDETPTNDLPGTYEI